MVHNEESVSGYVEEKLPLLTSKRPFEYNESTVRNTLNKLPDVPQVERAIAASQALSKNSERYDYVTDRKRLAFFMGSIEGLAASTNDEVVSLVERYFNSDFKQVCFGSESEIIERGFQNPQLKLLDTVGRISSHEIWNLDVLANVLLQAPTVKAAKSVLEDTQKLEALVDQIMTTGNTIGECKTWKDIAQTFWVADKQLAGSEDVRAAPPASTISAPTNTVGCVVSEESAKSRD